MNRVEIKSMAKAQIKGKIGILFVITLLVAVISFIGTFILNLVPVIGSLAASILIAAPLSLSIIMIYLGVASDKTPEIKDILAGFNDLWSAFKVQFLVGLFTALWSLLFVIPGIVKAISYSMSMYILAENKGMSALEAIRKSKEMMHGHKMDYFVLGLSFIGWLILVSITFGIAAIWVVPYMSTTLANFYKKVKGEDEPVVVETVAAEPVEEVIEELPAAEPEVVPEPEVIEEPAAEVAPTPEETTEEVTEEETVTE